MGSVQTLHDFTLNLLNDTAARAAFANDPQQVLADAGLGDINAADVHEVVPLVLDFVPVETATDLGGTTAATVDGLAGFGGITSVVNGTDGECADGVQGAIDQLTALTAGLPVAIPGAGTLPGLPEAGLPAVPGLPELGGLPAVPGLPAVSDVTDVSNAAAGVTALAQNTVGSFGLTGDLSQGLDAVSVGQAGGLANGAVETSTGLVGDVSVVDAVPVVGSVPVVGDLNSDLPRVDGVTGGTSDFSSTVGDLTSVIGQVGVADVTTKVHDIAGKAHDIGNGIGNGIGNVNVNAIGNVANDVTDNVATDVTDNVVNEVANHAGVNDVHDVVSGVANNIGHVGDINLGAGDIGSGNDIHLG
ncbi:IniB N-terminal domain-containing protein [Amycolatopsis sp. QT-25]|uniref:IniB N-terminal domain-containing protein n=1 Tax=Amycolatopsis sp. QT-25 TaxID=3034022 RepID=UPI0023EB607A|nr:IniB N-terminal domain-containing protein [Amycolatopsis sp. QT-25]WET81126.1 IniB N-terminal domain-containing protein [Amycolatopsis sp. QT-25]